VCELGGRFIVDLTVDVKVLVSNNVLTPKYIAAIGAKIPVVTRKWLDDSLEAGAFLTNYQRYKVPIFAGLVFSSF
jgi:hypothetical protein